MISVMTDNALSDLIFDCLAEKSRRAQVPIGLIAYAVLSVILDDKEISTCTIPVDFDIDAHHPPDDGEVLTSDDIPF